MGYKQRYTLRSLARSPALGAPTPLPSRRLAGDPPRTAASQGDLASSEPQPGRLLHATAALVLTFGLKDIDGIKLPMEQRGMEDGEGRGGTGVRGEYVRW